MGGLGLSYYFQAPPWAIVLGVIFALNILPISLAAFTYFKYQRKSSENYLKFVFEHRPPYEIIKYVGDSDKWESCKFGVGVKNIGQEYLKSCSVILQALSPSDGTWYPRPLKLAKDNPTDILNTSHIQSFPLYIGDEEIIDIVRIDKNCKNMKICFAKEDQRDLHLKDTIPIGDFCFTLRAGAEIGGSFRQTYCLQLDRTTGEMKFGPLGLGD